MRWRLPVALAVLVLCAGCANRQPKFGEEATLFPKPYRLERALKSAACDPHVWAPTAGALVFGLTGWDDDVSDWAVRETPIFGSPKDAQSIGGDILDVTTYAVPVTAVAANSGTRPGEVAWNKTKALAFQAAAWQINKEISDELKTRVKRERPSRANRRSFPSDRASRTSVAAAMSRRNLDFVRMDPRWRPWAKGTLTAAELAVAWSRIEAGAHYPSDVLAGMAIGNFIGVFVTDAFVGRPGDAFVHVGPTQDGDGIQAGVSFDH